MRLSEFFDKYSDSEQRTSTSLHREKIRENLWLGSARARKHLEGIDVVISVLTEFERDFLNYQELDNLIIEYKIELDDSAEAPLIPALDQVEKILDEELARGHSCLVHCLAGRSRSAAIVIGYLMRNERLSFSQALQEVQRLRPVASPNGGFRRQLGA